MTAMPSLRPILNDTPANAIDVDWNFQAVEDYVTTDVVKRDGSVAMEAPLNLLGAPPSLPTHAITKGYVDTQIIPIGVIWEFAGAVAPPGWALCDGAVKSTTDPAYAALFAVIDTKYNLGTEGPGNFALPDKRTRVGVGFQSGDALFGVLGQRGGNRNAIVPNHVHPMTHVHPMGDHFHGMAGHQHQFQHMHDLQNHSHDSNVRNGYAVNSANQPGESNAVWKPGMTVPVSFVTHETAITKDILDGAQHQLTGGPTPNNTGWIQNSQTGHPDHTAAPNVANTVGMTAATNTSLPNAPDTQQPVGAVTPTNANVQPYLTVNFIIRIG